MEVTLAGVAAVGLLVSVLLLLGGSMVRGPRDMVLVLLLVFCQFYVLRPVVFALGLDTPFPDREFAMLEDTEHVAQAVLVVTLFLTLTLAGVAVVRSTGTPGWGPFVRGTVDLRRAMLVTAILTLGATAVSAWLLLSFGGVGGVISAAKVDKSLAGLYVLRALPAVGAVVGVGTYLEARSVGASARVRVAALSMALLDAGSVFLWGSRSLLVVVGAALALGMRSRRTPAEGRREEWSPDARVRWQVLLRLAAACLIVIAAASGLRMARDTLVNGDVQEVYAQATPARQVSLAVNATYFDATVLAVRDWPRRHDYRAGEDFATGLLGVVPRLVWADKPAAVAPGVWFRQVYEPEKRNGWPMGAAGLWYLNFGWWGVALGGMLSGAVLGMLSAAQLRRPDSGFNTAIAVAVGVYVVGLGVDSDIVVRMVLWLLPLWLVARFVTRRDQGPAAGADGLVAAARSSAG